MPRMRFNTRFIPRVYLTIPVRDTCMYRKWKWIYRVNVCRWCWRVCLFRIFQSTRSATKRWHHFSAARILCFVCICSWSQLALKRMSNKSHVNRLRQWTTAVRDDTIHFIDVCLLFRWDPCRRFATCAYGVDETIKCIHIHVFLLLQLHFHFLSHFHIPFVSLSLLFLPNMPTQAPEKDTKWRKNVIVINFPKNNTT